MKILIAEDDPISRRILEANLLEWGYEVMIASDGVAIPLENTRILWQR